MTPFSKFILAVAAGFVGSTGVALAAPNFVPEPGSIALVALGVAGALWFGRGRK